MLRHGWKGTALALSLGGALTLGCTGELLGGAGGGGDDGGGGGGDGDGGGGGGGGIDGTGMGTPIPGLPAFPGAEGFGAVSTGGRGGAVYKVTTLEPFGAGSLGEALEQEGPRTIVFAVSGVIEGDFEIPYGDVTIAGQTAPGAGITIRGYLHTAYGAGYPIENLTIRHLRVRLPPTSGVGGDAIQFSQANKFILDHLSIAWGSDELVDIYEAADVTVQWSTLEESDPEGHPEGNHNYAMINGPDGRRASIHHNLFAHHRHRSPALANGPSSVVNNVIYDFRQGFHHDNDPDTLGFNVVGNYYKPGLSADPVCFNLTAPGRYYFAQNYVEGGGMIPDDPCPLVGTIDCLNADACNGDTVTTPFETALITVQPPEAAYADVLARAGTWPRDAVTLRTIQEVRNGTGMWGRNEPGNLLEGLTAGDPPTDADNDGMADDWEAANGLDSGNGDDHSTVRPSGYTAIEEYVNQLADSSGS